MAADLKSHVLRRDEKGFAGIPFKRLLLGGVSGGMVLVISRFALGNLAFALAVVTVVLTLALTAPRGAEVVFAPPEREVEADMTEWITSVLYSKLILLANLKTRR